MRFLFLLPDLAVPPSKGYQVRAVAMADALQRTHDVQVVASRGQSASSWHSERRVIYRIATVPLVLRREMPVQAALFDGPDAVRHARELVDSWRPDAVIVY